MYPTYSFYMPGQKRIFFWAKVYAFFLGFIIAAFIFTGLGYWWRMIQVDPEFYQMRIELRKNAEMISALEAKLGVMQGKGQRRK